MKILTISVLSALFVCGPVALDAVAQKGAGQQQGVARQVAQPELVTLSGVVVEVKSGPCTASTGRAVTGTHIVLKTEDGATREVHVGPQRDVEALIKGVEAGQTLTVTGFRTDRIAENALVAKTLKVNEETIALRDDSLRPVWAAGSGRGQGRGRGQQADAWSPGRGHRVGPAFTAAQGRRGRGMQQGQGPGFRNGRGQAYAGEKEVGKGTGPGQGCGFCGGCGQGCRAGGPDACMAPGQGKVAPGQGKGKGQGRGGLGKGQSCRAADGRGCMQQLGSLIESKPKGKLSRKDREGLMLMREEEKLAHDVYVTLHKSWDLPPFANIPWAESRHMEAVKTLLDRYEIEDPITNMTVGVFQNQELQELYNKLLAQGRQSVEEAIKVGTLIEELNIADLQKLVKDAKSEDLRLVYQHLLRGSRNHLRAFTRQLQRYNGKEDSSSSTR